MKLRLIMPLLVIVAAFLFTGEVIGQTNGTFNNLTVRNNTRLMGTTYIDTALYLRGLKPHIVAMNSQWVLLLDSVTENVYKIRLSALADSVPIPAQYWTFVDAATDTLKNNVATGGIILLNAITEVPNRFTAYTNNTYLGYDAIGESVRQLGMWSGGGYASDSSAYLTVTHSDALSTVTGSAWNSYNSATISAQADSSSIGIVTLTASDKYFNVSSIGVGSENITIAAEELAEMSGKVSSVVGDSAAAIGSPGGGTTCWEDRLEFYTNFYLSISAADSITINSPSIIYEDTFWDDMTTSAESAKLGINDKPVFDYDSLASRWDNADTTTNYLVFNYQLKHTYSAGTDIYPHVHYIQSSAADTAEWFIILYKWTDLGEARPANFTRIHSNNQTAFPYSSGSIHQLATFPYVEGTGHTESSIVEIRLYCWSDGELLTKEFDIHFQINKPGSDNEYP